MEYDDGRHLVLVPARRSPPVAPMEVILAWVNLSTAIVALATSIVALLRTRSLLHDVYKRRSRNPTDGQV